MLWQKDIAGIFGKRLLPDPQEVWTGHLIEAVLARQDRYPKSHHNQLFGNQILL